MSFDQGIKPTLGITGSRPQTYDKARVCKNDNCTTIISKYNKGPFCYVHAPPKKVRVRGTLPSEEWEKIKKHPAACINCLAGNRGGAPLVLDNVMHISGDNGNATVCEE